VRVVRAVWGAPGLRCLHDPTEGGIATACWEMAGAGLRLEVDDGVLLVHPCSERIARALEIDWRGMLASGSLLAEMEARDAPALVARAGAAGQAAAVVGGFEADPSGGRGTAILRSPEGSHALPRFTRDETLRALTWEA
jgi:hydrogenase expression/formation protein HypE